MTGLIFGSFDGLHPGHDFLINRASVKVNSLHVILARDSSIRYLKNREPRFKFSERKRSLEDRYENITVHEGDKDLGVYEKVVEIKPDIVIFGYDQLALKEDFESWMKKNKKSFTIDTIEAFKENIYKSSLIYD